MQFDTRNLVSDQQSLVLGLGNSVLSDKSLPLAAATPAGSNVVGPITTDAFGGTAGGDLGKAKSVDFLVQVTKTVVGAGASLEFQLVKADDAALTTNLTVLRTTGAVGVANLVAGYRPNIGGQLPEGITSGYVGLKVINSGAATTDGAMTAGIVLDRETA